jgi:hypothetical protein
MRTLLPLLLALAAFGSMAQAAEPPPTDPRPIEVQLADEVTRKMLENPEYASRVAAGRKPRIVVGAVRNDTQDTDPRVDDIFAEIRNGILASGTAQLYPPGQLDVDLIIAPVLTSTWTPDGRNRARYCMTLQLSLTRVSTEYFASHSATRCVAIRR